MPEHQGSDGITHTHFNLCKTIGRRKRHDEPPQGYQERGHMRRQDMTRFNISDKTAFAFVKTDEYRTLFCYPAHR